MSRCFLTRNAPLYLLGTLLLPLVGATEVDEIVVSATRIEQNLADVPASVSVIEAAAIHNGRQLLSFDEALIGVPGLFIQDRYNFAQDLRISIRGFGARAGFGIRGVRIIVDGIPETLPDGQAQSDSIDTDAISRIEVLRGPSSALYGNASGGVISITTERPTETAYLEASIATGSFGYRHLGFKAAGKAGRLGYFLSAADKRLDGFRDHSETENRLFNARLQYAVTENSDFSLTLSHTDQPLANDPGGVDLISRNANPQAARPLNVAFASGEALDQQRLGLSYHHRVRDNAELTLRNYYVWRDFENQLPFTGGGTVVFERFSSGGGASLAIDNTLFGLNGRAVFGLDVDLQEDDRQRYDNVSGQRGPQVFDQLEEITALGAFVQQQIDLSDRVTLSAGLRFDDIGFDVSDRFLSDGDDSGKTSFSEFSPMLGVLVNASESLSLFANLGRSFETPTSTELANPNGGGFNEALRPQIARSAEIGLRHRVTPQLNYEVAIFRIDVDDELVSFELASQPGRDFFENAGESRRQGIEAALFSQFTESIGFSLSYTASDFSFEKFTDSDGNDFADNRLPGLARSVAAASLDYKDESGYFGGVEFQHVGSLSLNNANTDSTDAYTLANIRFGRRFDVRNGQVEFYGGINNATDEDYNANVRINAFGGRFFEAAPDRNYYLGARYRWQH